MSLAGGRGWLAGGQAAAPGCRSGSGLAIFATGNPTDGGGQLGVDAMKLSRRKVLKASAGASAVVAAPAVLRAPDALATSGQVDVFAWGDYIQKNQIDAFENATGIKINLSTYGSNDEAENKLRAAGGKGFDVIFPSVTNCPNYYRDDLLQPLDEAKLETDAVIQSMLRDSIKLGATHRGKRYALPFNWGTEALTFDSARHPWPDAEVSYGNLWLPEVQKAAAFRQKSALFGVGLYLDATGKVPSDRMLAPFASEEECRRVFAACTQFILDNKDKIGAFWNNATEATAAFTDSGCTVGQTWDTTGLLLNRQDPKWQYKMPKEGGITWMDSVAIPSGAANLEQAYAFINAMLTPEQGGMMSGNTGYNSAVQGAADHAGEDYKKQFAQVYNEQNLASLWWWQADTPWITAIRNEYVEKITNA